MASTPEQPVPSSFSKWRWICRLLLRGMLFLWAGIVLAIGIGFVANVAVLTTATPLDTVYLIHWMMIYPLPIICVTGGLVILTFLAWMGSREHLTSLILSSDQQNHLGIGNALRKAYTDELEASLQGIARVTLGMHERFDMTHPTRLVSWKPGQPERPLPTGTTIVDTYDKAGNGLLILGEPGAGKSTILYDLAQNLLTRAEQNEKYPLPIILNLSSWVIKRQPLRAWLAEELEVRYLIPRVLGQRWQQEGRWLLLLDGLDEVWAEKRLECIEAINAYHAAQVVPMVVCSRYEEYLAVSKQLTFQSAVIVQPLTPEQVKTYIKDAGRPLAAVRKVIQTNTVLLNLLTTPLMLSVVALTYKDKTIKDIPQIGSPAEQQRYIFASYLQRMLYAHGPVHSENSEHMRRWLVQLAKQMHARNQSLLYVEQLQPDWLLEKWTRRFYIWWGVYFPSILIGSLVSVGINGFFGGLGGLSLLDGLLGGLLGGILSYRYILSSTMTPVLTRHSTFAKLVVLIFLGLSFGLSFGLIDLTNHFTRFPLITGICFGITSILLAILPYQGSKLSLKGSHIGTQSGGMKKSLWGTILPFKPSLHIGGLIGLSYGLSVGLSNGLEAGLGHGLNYGLGLGLLVAMFNGLSYGLSVLLLSILLVQIPTTISSTEIIMWSWKSLWISLLRKSHQRKAFLLTIGTGLVTALAEELGTGLINVQGEGLVGSLKDGLSVGLSYGLFSGLVVGGSYWLLIGLFQGISSQTFSEKQRIIPNQGIHRSIHNGLLLGGLSFVISAFISGFGLILNNRLIEELNTGLSVGLREGPNKGFSAMLSLAINGGLSDGLILGLINGILLGLIIGCLVTILMGGLAWWRHWVVRFLLWRSGTIPWRVVLMLDEAARHILLRKSGGGYRFIHDLFRDYLASLDTSTPSDLSIPPLP